MPAYHAAFLSGEAIRVADEQTLKTFQREWTYHHPLQEEQIAYAGKRCFVKSIGIYHGGDCLYQLSTHVKDSPTSRYSHEEPVPGLWHECCLRDQDMKDWKIPLPLASEVYSVTAERRADQPVVIVRTLDGMECLVMRHLHNEREAAFMAEVSRMRNTLSFEWRYKFQGVAHDLEAQRLQEIRSRKEEQR